jgi:hypothetical protein
MPTESNDPRGTVTITFTFAEACLVRLILRKFLRTHSDENTPIINRRVRSILTRLTYP